MFIHIQSRTGNIVIGLLGLTYAVAAIALLSVYISQTWGAAGLIDRALQMMLIGSALAGCWFVLIATNNLRKTATGNSVARPHRATAAA